MSPQPDDPGTATTEEALVKRLRALVQEVNSVATALSRCGVEVEFNTRRVDYIGFATMEELRAKARKVLL